MKRSKMAGLALIALSSTLIAQEVIILDSAPPAPRALRRNPAPQDRQRQPAGANINAEILMDEGARGIRSSAPDDVFYDGQRFRLRVNSDAEGHFYVLCLNSQGTANVLFPTPQTDAMASILDRRASLTVPDNAWFQFDSEPGVERVFLLVSSRPIDDLERAVDQGGKLSSAVLRRYTTGRPSQRQEASAKGLTFTGSDILVRKLELIHDSRN